MARHRVHHIDTRIELVSCRTAIFPEFCKCIGAVSVAEESSPYLIAGFLGRIGFGVCRDIDFRKRILCGSESDLDGSKNKSAANPFITL